MGPGLRRFGVGEVVAYTGTFEDESGRSGPPAICDSKPVVVLEDREDLIALWLAEGTPTRMPAARVRGQPRPWRRDEWELRDAVWSWCSALFLIVPGEWRATWLLWFPESAGSAQPGQFMGWYVNIQEPIRRTPAGFDHRDLELDVVVEPDGRSRLKDEEELARAEKLGVLSPRIAERARDEARRVRADVEAARWPFDRIWSKPAAAVALRFVDRIHRGDLAGLVALMSEDHRLEVFGEKPVLGREANREAWRGYMTAFPRYVIHPRRIHVEEDRVAILGHTTGSHLGLADAEESKLTLIWVAHIRDSAVKRWLLIEDTPPNRQRLGLDR